MDLIIIVEIIRYQNNLERQKLRKKKIDERSCMTMLKKY